jgi:dihydrofolate synthase/folylpolyglutamate synthase
VTHKLNDWLELLESRHPKAIDLGLERCRDVWRRMGCPMPSNRLFTVAGTNGKGSTVAWICGMLKGLGYSYASYTTPHLMRYNERIRICGREASDEELLEAFAAVEAARGSTSLSYFEFGTLAAFHIMSQSAPDYAVLEVGLGGRLDAVNILDADCAVITAIALDHQEYLGSDRESIGAEKAGIIRSARPLICGEAAPPASIVTRARRLQAPLFLPGRDFTITPNESGALFTMGDIALQLPTPPLSGAHQLDNMAAAMAALLQLVPAAADKQAQIFRSLSKVNLPGRLQRLSSNPEVLVDVGHNPLAARIVARHLESRSYSDIRCVLGMLADKDVESVVRELNGRVGEWYCAGLDGVRGQTGEALASAVGAADGVNPVRVYDDVDSAMVAALENPRAAQIILVFGSFLTAAAAIRFMQHYH